MFRHLHLPKYLKPEVVSLVEDLLELLDRMFEPTNPLPLCMFLFLFRRVALQSSITFICNGIWKHLRLKSLSQPTVLVLGL